MKVSKNFLDLSKENSSEAILNMINWSLPKLLSLEGSHLIGLNLPKLLNTIMYKTANNLFLDLNACNKYTLLNDLELKKN